MWHMTYDTWHVTCDTWCGVNILSKFHLASTEGLGGLMLWRLGGKGWITKLPNKWINDEGVYRTVPTTLGLLKIVSETQLGTNIWIFEYILTNIFIHLNIYWFFQRGIYSDIHLWSIYTNKYIWIFICPISLIVNELKFSLLPKNV